MEPDEALPQILEAATHAALTDGMPADLAEITFAFGDEGVTIRAKASDGTDYEAEMSRDEIAAALDAVEASEDHEPDGNEPVGAVEQGADK